MGGGNKKGFTGVLDVFRQAGGPSKWVPRMPSIAELVESGHAPDRLHVAWNLGVDLMWLTCAQLRKGPRLS